MRAGVTWFGCVWSTWDSRLDAFGHRKGSYILTILPYDLALYVRTALILVGTKSCNTVRAGMNRFGCIWCAWDCWSDASGNRCGGAAPIFLCFLQFWSWMTLEEGRSFVFLFFFKFPLVPSHSCRYFKDFPFLWLPGHIGAQHALLQPEVYRYSPFILFFPVFFFATIVIAILVVVKLNGAHTQLARRPTGVALSSLLQRCAITTLPDCWWTLWHLCHKCVANYL